jgi:ferredoxin
MLGIERNSIDIKNIPLQGSVKAPEKAVSRREFLEAFRTKATRIAAAAIPDVEDSGDDKAEVFRNAVQERRENRKRSRLVGRIRELSAKSGVNPIAVPSKDAITADIEIGPGCTACGVCASLCPTGAITRQWTEKTFSLSFSPALCTNCRICEKTCMHGAVKMNETVSLSLLLEHKKTVLFETAKKTCIACCMDFIGEGAEICPLCLDRNKKQTAVLQKLFK